jgi:protein-S-isoprenylcysteine O-methyltransferase Ste14
MSGGAWHTLSVVATAVCWGAFAVVWIAGSLYNARRGPRVRERSKRDRSWLVAVLALWLIFGHPFGLDWESLRVSSPWIRAPGIVLLASATAFTLWARVALGRMWSASVVAKAGHTLRTEGPYAVTRHPIYTGIAGMLLGTAMVNDVGSMAAVFVLGVVYVVAKARAEERLLGGVFPEYEAYRQRVPQLIPGGRGLGRIAASLRARPRHAPLHARER